MATPRTFALALLLVSCNGGDKQDPVSDDSAADTDSTDDTASSTDDTGTSDWTDAYAALSNSWYKAPVGEVTLSDTTTWSVGGPVPNLEMIDQNGDTVWLYQFTGKIVVLDIFGTWCEPCRNNVPYLEALWEELGEDIIVVGLLEQDEAGDPGSASNVAEWVGEYGTTHPVVYLSAEDRAKLPELYSFPTISVIDPQMRLAVSNLLDFQDDYMSQMYSRVRLMAKGDLDQVETCEDGWDNDLNGKADCMESACAAECAEQSVTGSLAPCYTEEAGEASPWDIYTVEVGSGTVTFEVDMVNAENRFDVVAVTRSHDGGWEAYDVLGDDEFTCTYPLDTFGCAQGWLRPGTWEVAVKVGGGSVQGDCGDPAEARYELRVQGDATVTLSEDDVAPKG